MAPHLFLIDPSAVGRLHLHQSLAAAGFEITGTATDPGFAWPKLQARWPNVIVLDIEWPRLDITGFLKRLHAERPTPVVVCAAHLEPTDPVVQSALAAGAVAFAVRRSPTAARAAAASGSAGDSDQALVTAVRQAARAAVCAPAGRPHATVSPPHATPLHTAPATQGMPMPMPMSPVATSPRTSAGRPSSRVVAIGISTGGVQSIEAVLRHLGPENPGIVLVQHMPEKFTASFAARLNSQYALEVLEARDGDVVHDGRVLIAPGGKQMTLRRQGSQYAVEVRDGPPVNHHRPSVDVLFSSVARCAGRQAVGIIMTGMGADGARGLLEMREAGAATAAQDEASCIVFGMPAEAIRLGAAQEVLPLGRIADWITSTSHRSGRPHGVTN
ncbi:chemotaxis-specific protein-glutamate methyltransferase CheB [Sphaerotilus sp.]|uniref:chemotaxis-specific protein-glutamate methyltransferase CheB n=1 Tax=Sphaerotilus sp. TaxID=2093942 RepID=UPI002ACDB8F1|nr:chemotaxis-specific protein-glutamate methyltransferase CheB [Sphaerotilus sp.]MDZ7856079.1 chemotaxis-specific protein-glutamate methyltransferase CheB [Sphaerotilus sp.]